MGSCESHLASTANSHSVRTACSIRLLDGEPKKLFQHAFLTREDLRPPLYLLQRLSGLESSSRPLICAVRSYVTLYNLQASA